LVGTGKQKGLESLSKSRKWRRRYDVGRQLRQVVPGGGTRNRKSPLADYRETNGRNAKTTRSRRPQPSSGCHVGNAGETWLGTTERCCGGRLMNSISNEAGNMSQENNSG